MSGVIAHVSEPPDPYRDRAAFYVAQFRPVVRTVYLILYDREHAEDVTQDAFVQLYLHWSKVARYEAPHAWVRRIAIRTAVRAARRDQRRQVLSRLAVDPFAQAPEPMDLDPSRSPARPCGVRLALDGCGDPDFRGQRTIFETTDFGRG
jgi:DNA-directed RNA polymerase specialized sigma24 family protein